MFIIPFAEPPTKVATALARFDFSNLRLYRYSLFDRISVGKSLEVDTNLSIFAYIYR